MASPGTQPDHLPEVAAADGSEDDGGALASALALLEELPVMRRAFVVAYLGSASCNATAAARAAGYAYPKQEAPRLLADPAVAEVIQAVTATTASKLIADAREVGEFLTGVMRGDIGTPVFNLAGQPTGAIEPPSIRERTKAAVELSKLRGYDAPARHEVSMQEHLKHPAVSVEDAKAFMKQVRGGHGANAA